MPSGNRFAKKTGCPGSSAQGITRGKMKTLYSILGLTPEATTAQIESAYATFLAKLQSGAGGLSAEEAGNQLVAVKEAYAVLSNPVARQRYNQKLFAPETFHAQSAATAFGAGTGAGSTPGGGFGIAKIAVVGAIALLGLYLYSNSVKERERLRIEHEHKVLMKAVQVEEDRQNHNAQVQDVILEKSINQVDDRQLRLDQQHFERESAMAQRQEMQQRQLEMQQQQQALREEERRQRQEQSQRQQQMQSEKRYLQQLERERYGRVITH